MAPVNPLIAHSVVSNMRNQLAKGGEGKPWAILPVSITNLCVYIQHLPKAIWQNAEKEFSNHFGIRFEKKFLIIGLRYYNPIHPGNKTIHIADEPSLKRSTILTKSLFEL